MNTCPVVKEIVDRYDNYGNFFVLAVVDYLGGVGMQLLEFKTQQDADRVIKNNPGISLRDLADKVSHHYSSKASAMGMFRDYIERFGEKYRLEKDGRELRVYPIPIVGK